MYAKSTMKYTTLLKKNKNEGKEPNAREVALLWEVIQ